MRLFRCWPKQLVCLTVQAGKSIGSMRVWTYKPTRPHRRNPDPTNIQEVVLQKLHVGVPPPNELPGIQGQRIRKSKGSPTKDGSSNSGRGGSADYRRALLRLNERGIPNLRWNDDHSYAQSVPRKGNNTRDRWLTLEAERLLEAALP